LDNLTNIIEAALFASGNSISIKFLAEKLDVSTKAVEKSLQELSEKYTGECGIYLLNFNGKAQFATNPTYKDEVSLILSSIKEKEFTKTILECAAIVAYKQPITRGELEEIRRVNSDYAIRTLLDLGMIAPCGRKDAIGHPVLYGTTDKFLKRFKISELGDLPDYESLMSQIAQLGETSESSYLYSREEYHPEEETAAASAGGTELPAEGVENDEAVEVIEVVEPEEGGGEDGDPVE
jgi:segregation and condensation protein B